MIYLCKRRKEYKDQFHGEQKTHTHTSIIHSDIVHSCIPLNQHFFIIIESLCNKL